MVNEKRRVWFVTGASRGIGAEIVAAALHAGDQVVATARSEKAVLERFGERPELLAVALDVTDEAAVARAVEKAVERFGRIDVLVNNAGFGVIGAVEETRSDDVRRLYETNVFGLLNVTRAVLPKMRAQRSGHILNLSSLGGYRSSPGFGLYCSTKFAVEGISEALHTELAPLGIRVTIVEPGYFRTDFLDAKSVVEAPTRIADYDGTAGEVRSMARSRNHEQPGDPKKLALTLVAVVRSPSAPLRLPLGADAVAAIETKHAFVASELATWREVAMSTGYAD